MLTSTQMEKVRTNLKLRKLYDVFSKKTEDSFEKDSVRSFDAARHLQLRLMTSVQKLHMIRCRYQEDLIDNSDLDLDRKRTSVAKFDDCLGRCDLTSRKLVYHTMSSVQS